MRRPRWKAAAFAAVALLAAWSLTTADEMIWVDAHGEPSALGTDADPLTFDLSELADGETREFGTGERTIRVTRHGEVATIERDGEEGRSRIATTCRIGVDTCRVAVGGGETERLVIMVNKIRECRDGMGDCDDALAEVDGDVSDDAERVVITRRVHFDDDAVLLRCPHGDATLSVEADEADQLFLCPKHAEPLERPRGGPTVIELRRPAGANGPSGD